MGLVSGAKLLKIKLIALGKTKNGPEHNLILDYLKRSKAVGRSYGINEIDIIDVDKRKVTSFKELEEILGYRLKGKGVNNQLVSLDSRGVLMSSLSFSRFITNLIQDGVYQLGFFIGGPDGIPPDVLKTCGTSISFGRFTYPHQLFKVMLLEQIYRATTIMAKHPYHKE